MYSSEAVAIFIVINNQSFTLISAYQPGSNIYIKELGDLLKNNIHNNNSIIIVSDLNLKHTSWSCKKSFATLMVANYRNILKIHHI